MITRFTCSNFKNVDVDKMELGKVNLLIGPNNAGKSNFIRALSFAANMTSVSSNEDSGFLTEIRRNGSIEILRHGYKDSPVHLNWRILLGGRAAEYTLDFCFDEELNTFKIVNESLDSGEALHGKERAFNYFRFHDMNPGFGMFSTAYQIGDTNNKRIHVPARVDETGLRQFDKLVISNKNLLKNDYIRETMFTMLEELRSYFLKFYSYGSSQFDFEKVRQLQEPTAKDSRLTKDGSNFLSVYQYAKAVDSDFEERFLNKMQELIIDLKDIRIVEGLDKIGMKLLMCKSEYMLSEVSDGTIELVCLKKWHRHSWRLMSQKSICIQHGKIFWQNGFKLVADLVSALSVHILQIFWMHLQRDLKQDWLIFLYMTRPEKARLSLLTVNA